ncbi:MFS transporter [Streptomyces sp. 8L]|uniref:MFS transporter n=1 Tax=Streptomyces sp. 8L TaxID=2877242 RepID=UPI001CD4C68E|nr:MFS transporter [Streptomyces sp. 8L]MCA1217358.1 MFS transporter [Streptomyces sp. 8L]
MRTRTDRWPPGIRALLVTTLVTRSAGFSYPFLTYHLSDIGYSATMAGQIASLFGVGWLVGQLTTGWAADRFGRRRVLVTVLTTAAFALPLLAQARDLDMVCIGTFIAGTVYDAPRPVITSLIAELLPDPARQAAVSGWRYGAVNVGAAFTGAAGGLLASAAGYAALFWLNGAASAMCALAVVRVLPPDRLAADPRALTPDQPRLRLDPLLWLLWAASLCALTCASDMFSALPLLMQSDRLPATSYGWTQVANSAAVLILTPLLTPWLSRLCAGHRPRVGMLALSSLLLGAGMGSAGLAHTTWQYSAAVGAAVPGEILLYLGASDVLSKISPPHLRGAYAGVWGSSLAVAVIVAPVLASWSLATGGGELVALTTLATGVLGAALSAPLAALARVRAAFTSTHLEE